MPIPVICSCSAKLKVGDHLQGQHIKCPKCGSVIPVGTANGSAPVPAAPPPAPRATPPAPPAASTKQVLEESGLSPEERERLEAELERDERLLWAGKPVERFVFLRAWGISVGFFFGVVVVVVIMILTANHGLAKDFMGVLTMLFLGTVALGFAGAGAGWPFLQRWYARKTTYAVTTKRALIWGRTRFGKATFGAYDPADLAKFYRVDVSKGSDPIGHLIFGTQVTRRKTKDGIVETHHRYGFFLIRRAAEVERMIRDHLVDPLLDKLYDD